MSVEFILPEFNISYIMLISGIAGKFFWWGEVGEQKSGSGNGSLSVEPQDKAPVGDLES